MIVRRVVDVRSEEILVSTSSPFDLVLEQPLPSNFGRQPQIDRLSAQNLEGATTGYAEDQKSFGLTEPCRISIIHLNRKNVTKQSRKRLLTQTMPFGATSSNIFGCYRSVTDFLGALWPTTPGGAAPN
jgi:hypothetical protein